MDSLVFSIRPIPFTITELQTWISLLLQQMSCITFMSIKQLQWTEIELKLAELVEQLICLPSQFEIKAPTIYSSSSIRTKQVYANTILLCIRRVCIKYKNSKSMCTTLRYKYLCKFWIFTCWLVYLKDRCGVCFIDTFSTESRIRLNH